MLSSFLYYHPLFIPFFFFFTDTATTEIYTLSLHDALPICLERYEYSLRTAAYHFPLAMKSAESQRPLAIRDRKSTRLNSSHPSISYAVFCLKKKKKTYYCGTTLTSYKSHIWRTTNCMWLST